METIALRLGATATRVEAIADSVAQSLLGGQWSVQGHRARVLRCSSVTSEFETFFCTPLALGATPLETFAVCLEELRMNFLQQLIGQVYEHAERGQELKITREPHKNATLAGKWLK